MSFSPCVVAPSADASRLILLDANEAIDDDVVMASLVSPGRLLGLAAVDDDLRPLSSDFLV